MWKSNNYGIDYNLNENLISSINRQKPKSIASIGGKESYKIIIPIHQHFNWFQKLM